jgi:hypothetical protein
VEAKFRTALAQLMTAEKIAEKRQLSTQLLADREKAAKSAE